LKRLPTGKRDALDGIFRGYYSLKEKINIGFIPPFGIVGFGIETARTIEGAALEPDNGAQPRPVGSTGGFKSMKTQFHVFNLELRKFK